MLSTKISCTWTRSNCAAGFRTGVSLHSHTKHSHEKLQFIPAFAEKWPILDRALARQCKRTGVAVDFSRAYWTPPLTPMQAFDVESKQIENTLGLASLVSITDHDSIQAPSLLRMTSETAATPLSLEWTVPFHGAEFHLGIHNLPPNQATDIVEDLARYTRNSSSEGVTELLTMLDALPETLIVFNHPFWDLNGLGPQQHALRITQFLQQNHALIHALELNGMRRWNENRKVKPLANRWQLPVVSGGDRHACEPSAAVNLTNAQSFPEFVNEIRREQRSHVLFMQQYNEPMCGRVMHALLDVVRYYPENPEGSRRWDDRVFYPGKTGVDQPLSAFWKASPIFIERIFKVLRLAETSTVQWTLKRVYAEQIDSRLFSDSPSEAAS